MMLWLLASCALVTEAEFQDRLDLDGDGHKAVRYGGDDCDDTVSTVHPGAEEQCAGVDQDCDGLVDCEDVDCEKKLVCLEANCDDGQDNDADGYADCLDDDCWGTACHPPTEAWVTSGNLRIDDVFVTSVATDVGCTNVICRGDAAQVAASDVAGVVRIPMSAARAEWHSCQWTVQSMLALEQEGVCTYTSAGGTYTFEYFVDATRSSVKVTGGCELAPSLFLPTRLFGRLDDKRVLTEEGDVWYLGGAATGPAQPYSGSRSTLETGCNVDIDFAGGRRYFDMKRGQPFRVEARPRK